MGQKYASYNTSEIVIGYYDSVDSPPPATATTIPITDSQWREAISSPYQPVTVANGALVIPSGPTLEDARTAQNATLRAACRAEIIGGFAATIGGSPATVTLSPTDQANALAASQAAQGVIAGAVPWSAGLNAPLDTIILVNGVYYIATTGGVTGTSLPTAWPTAFQQTIQDGSVEWAIFGILVGTTNGSVWATAQEIVALFKQGISFINGLRAKYNALKAQVNAATTVTAVQAIVW